MFEDVTFEEQRAVAVASSEASAELVAATLVANGIQAVATSADRLYPSVSWAQGYRVVVAVSEEAHARRLLTELAGDDLDGVDLLDDDATR